MNNETKRKVILPNSSNNSSPPIKIKNTFHYPTYKNWKSAQSRITFLPILV